MTHKEEAKKDYTEKEVTIKVRVYGKPLLFLHERLAEGTLGKSKYSLNLDAASCNIYLNFDKDGRFDNCRTVLLSPVEVVHALLKALGEEVGK